MCKVKIGAQIRNCEDIRNIIIGLILRQEEAFSKDDILESTLFYLKDSPIIPTTEILISMIQETLSLFNCYDLVVCQNGRYTSRRVSRALSLYYSK